MVVVYHIWDKTKQSQLNAYKLLIYLHELLFRSKCTSLGEGLRRSFVTPNPFVFTNKICLNQMHKFIIVLSIKIQIWI